MRQGDRSEPLSGEALRILGVMAEHFKTTVEDRAVVAGIDLATATRADADQLTRATVRPDRHENVTVGLA